MDPRDFALQFMNRELGGGRGIGPAVDRAELYLCLADAFLERGLTREALDAARAAAEANRALRPRALIIARICVQREVDAIRAALAPGQDGV